MKTGELESNHISNTDLLTACSPWLIVSTNRKLEEITAEINKNCDNIALNMAEIGDSTKSVEEMIETLSMLKKREWGIEERTWDFEKYYCSAPHCKLLLALASQIDWTYCLTLNPEVVNSRVISLKWWYGVLNSPTTLFTSCHLL